jgi:hypothetical protein
MGRVLGAAVAWVLGQTTICAADEPTVEAAPQPIVAPPEVNWYATTPPAAAAVSRPRRIRVNRSGAFVLGGLAYGHEHAFGRLDIGAPIPTHRLPRLRIVAAVESRYGSHPNGAVDVEDSDVDVAVMLQNDWRLPFDLRSGEIVFVVGAGLERAEHWERFPDEPYWPSRWDSMTAYSFDVVLAAQFRARSGFVVSVQPAQIELPLGDPHAPDSRWMVAERERSIGVALLVGYQLP